MVEFSKYVKMYENYKVRNRLGSGLSRAEVKELRESYSRESKKEKLRESLRERRNASVGAPKNNRITSLRGSRRAAVLAEARKENALAAMPVSGKRLSEADARRARLNKIRAIREARNARGSTFPVNLKLNEARAAYFKARRALREGDMDQFAGQAQVATQAVDAVAQNASVCSPEVVAVIQDLQDKINGLAQSVGINADTGMSPEGDPNAAVPAQADQPLEPVQVQESAALAAVRTRIAERKAALSKKAFEVSTLQENAATDQIMAGMKASGPSNMSLGTVNKKEDQLPKAPTVAEIAKGSGKGVVRWPNTKITKDPSSEMLGKGLVVNESEKPLDEQYVDRVLNEKKLDFKSVFKNGSVVAD